MVGNKFNVYFQSPNDINAKELLISQGAEIKEKLKTTMVSIHF